MIELRICCPKCNYQYTLKLLSLYPVEFCPICNTPISLKGGPCPVNGVYCQEGFCNECEHGRVRVMQIQGKAKQVFQYLKLAAEYRGKETLKEIVSEH